MFFVTAFLMEALSMSIFYELRLVYIYPLNNIKQYCKSYILYILHKLCLALAKGFLYHMKFNND